MLYWRVHNGQLFHNCSNFAVRRTSHVETSRALYEFFNCRICFVFQSMSCQFMSCYVSWFCPFCLALLQEMCNTACMNSQCKHTNQLLPYLQQILPETFKQKTCEGASGRQQIRSVCNSTKGQLSQTSATPCGRKQKKDFYALKADTEDSCDEQQGAYNALGVVAVAVVNASVVSELGTLLCWTHP